MKRITVLLADDHTIIREGLRLLLETAPDIEILAEAENGHQAVEQAEKLLPEIVLLDLAMPQLHGIAAARLISKKVPTAKVLILSAYSERREVHAAIQAGAAGFVIKQTAAHELLKAIREISKGNAYFSPQITKCFFSEVRNTAHTSASNSASGPSLTPRELEVLQLIVEGNTNKEMAAALFISVKTIEKHRQALMKKTNTHETASVTRYAISNGLIPCERPWLISDA
jgi:two-component system, NarL family, nitrate/nitrite response regulator NarL